MRTPLLTAFALFAAGLGRPDVSKTLDRAGPDAGGADLQTTAAELYRLGETSSDPKTRVEAHYHLAQTLERDEMPAAALIELMGIVRSGPAQPFYSRALEQLIE